MSRIAVVALSVLALAGCTNTQTAYVGNDYAQVAGTRMNISAVLVDSDFQSTGQEPNIETTLQPQPQDVLRTALMQHYRPNHPNQSGLPALRFNIKDASVTEQHTEAPTDFFSQLSGVQPDYTFNGRVEVEASFDRQAPHSGYVHAEATRTLEVKNASPAERARQVQGMVAQMVDDLIPQIDQQLSSNMGGYVISGDDQTINAERSGRWDHVYEDRYSRTAGMRVITTK